MPKLKTVLVETPLLGFKRVHPKRPKAGAQADIVRWLYMIVFAIVYFQLPTFESPPPDHLKEKAAKAQLLLEREAGLGKVTEVQSPLLRRAGRRRADPGTSLVKKRKPRQSLVFAPLAPAKNLSIPRAPDVDLLPTGVLRRRRERSRNRGDERGRRRRRDDDLNDHHHPEPLPGPPRRAPASYLEEPMCQLLSSGVRPPPARSRHSTTRTTTLLGRRASFFHPVNADGPARRNRGLAVSRSPSPPLDNPNLPLPPANPNEPKPPDSPRNPNPRHLPSVVSKEDILKEVDERIRKLLSGQLESGDEGTRHVPSLEQRTQQVQDDHKAPHVDVPRGRLSVDARLQRLEGEVRELKLERDRLRASNLEQEGQLREKDDLIRALQLENLERQHAATAGQEELTPGYTLEDIELRLSEIEMEHEHQLTRAHQVSRDKEAHLEKQMSVLSATLSSEKETARFLKSRVTDYESLVDELKTQNETLVAQLRTTTLRPTSDVREHSPTPQASNPGDVGSPSSERNPASKREVEGLSEKKRSRLRNFNSRSQSQLQTSQQPGQDRPTPRRSSLLSKNSKFFGVGRLLSCRRPDTIDASNTEARPHPELFRSRSLPVMKIAPPSPANMPASDGPRPRSKFSMPEFERFSLNGAGASSPELGQIDDQEGTSCNRRS